jgi:hypothetical protein
MIINTSFRFPHETIDEETLLSNFLVGVQYNGALTVTGRCCEIQFTLICPEAGKHGVMNEWCLLYSSMSPSGMAKLGQGAELLKTSFHISVDLERNKFQTSEPLVYD